MTSQAGHIAGVVSNNKSTICGNGLKSSLKIVFVVFFFGVPSVLSSFVVLVSRSDANNTPNSATLLIE